MGLDQAIHVVTEKPTDTEISPIIVARVFKHFVLSQKYDVVLLGKLVSIHLSQNRLLMTVANKLHNY